MKPITVTCPKCNEVSDLFLGSEAYMIILNCPSCQTPLIYYRGKTSEVTSEELKKIEKSGLVKNAGNLLKEISQYGIKLQGEKTTKPFISGIKNYNSNKKFGNISPPISTPLRAGYFTKDDLINLKIELETCKSVTDFLKRI